MKKNREQVKLMIFDFDGTIADSFGVFFNSINYILETRGEAQITEKKSRQLRDLSAKEAFKYFKIPNYQLPFAVNKIFQRMSENFSEVKLFKGTLPILRILKKNDIKLVLLTSNIKKNVQRFLNDKKIGQFFDAVYFKSGLFSKHIMIGKVVKKYKLKKNEVILIGDEVRDIKAACKSGIKIASVSWGYNSKNILRKNNPNFLIEKPSEILDIIEFGKLDRANKNSKLK